MFFYYLCFQHLDKMVGYKQKRLGGFMENSNCGNVQIKVALIGLLGAIIAASIPFFINKLSTETLVYKIEMDKSSTPTYLVAEKNWKSHSSDQRSILVKLDVPPSPHTTLQVKDVSTTSVAIILSQMKEKKKVAISLHEKKEIKFINHKYIIECKEIDNGTNGHLDWARFNVKVYE